MSAGGTDWTAWHEAYADPSSSLTRRLTVVRCRIGQALDELAPRAPVQVLSLCAGDGRDVLPALSVRPVAGTVTLVELDADLVASARRRPSSLA